ncbi:hypothetical protein CR513_05713, partial [Mucuna pruriens]
MGAMKAVEQREKELHCQIVTMKATMEKPRGVAMPTTEINKIPMPTNFHEVVVEPFDGTHDPHTHLQAFQTQMYINGGNDPLSCKLFVGTLRGMAMHWLATLPSHSIKSFNNLATSFVLQFVANRVKRLKAKGEILKSYLAQFNNAIVRGLRAHQFSDFLALRRLQSMKEIRTCAKKHIEAEEDQADWLEGEPKHPARPRDYRLNFTPLREKRAQILREMCHTWLLKFPKEVKDRFHRAYDHSIEECRTLQEQIERLIQEGHLGRYVLGKGKNGHVSLRPSRRGTEDEPRSDGRETRGERRDRGKGAD